MAVFFQRAGKTLRCEFVVEAITESFTPTGSLQVQAQEHPKPLQSHKEGGPTNAGWQVSLWEPWSFNPHMGF